MSYYGSASYTRRFSYRHPDLRSRLRREVRATAMPLELSEVVAHLRLDPGSETGPEAPLLTRMLAAAVGHAERYCSMATMSQEWTLALHRWPPHHQGLEVPYPPLDQLLGTTVEGGLVQIVDYLVEADDRFPAVLYPIGNIWPALANPPGPAAVEIRFRCGRTDPDEVPPEIKQAILMAVATWYENRESLQQFTLTPMLQIGWDELLVAYREFGFA